MARVDDAARRRFLDEHPAWELTDEQITRTFVRRDFKDAMAFVIQVALAAEVADHHPDIDIRWNKVTLTLTTHDEGALTARDTSLAAAIDEF